MSPQNKAIAGSPVLTGKHLVCGAGGSRAILGSAGAVAAADMAGVKFETIGGVSGGVVPAVSLAHGMTPGQLMRRAIDVDFSSLVPRHATPLHTIIAFLLKDRFEYTRPKKGVLSSENLGRYFDELVPVWPKGFWTMAVVARTQVLFTDHGVFQYLRNGQRRLISDEPASVGIAVRATCAVPGIIDAAPFKGRFLFDGALSWDGQCPVGVPIKHFNADPCQIIGCDVGDDQERYAGLVRGFWSLLCGGHCVDHVGPKSEIPAGVLMINPDVRSVRSLEFTLKEDQKWEAVLSGFQEATIQLSRAGLLTGDRQKEAFSICMDMEKLKALAAR